MISLALALLLTQVPSPPTGWTRAEVEQRFGPPTFAGPLAPPWEEGAAMASYSQPVTDTNGLCRRHIGTVRGAVWMALVYYDAKGNLISVHCVQLGDLDTGYDVTPDVLRRLRGDGT